MHGAFVSALLSAVVHVVISLKTQPDEEKGNSLGSDCKFLSVHELSVFIKTPSILPPYLRHFGYFGGSGYHFSTIAMDWFHGPLDASTYPPPTKRKNVGVKIYREDRLGQEVGELRHFYVILLLFRILEYFLSQILQWVCPDFGHKVGGTNPPSANWCTVALRETAMDKV